MTGRKPWAPDKEEALRALIRETIKEAGPIDPETLPHRVKARLKGRAMGDLDVDAYIHEVVEDLRRRRM